MATLSLQNTSESAIDTAIAAVGAGPALNPAGVENPYFVTYIAGANFIDVSGNGLTFTAAGRLTGGTITGLLEFSNTPATFDLTNLQLPFSVFSAFAAQATAGGEPLQAIFAGDDQVTLTTPTAPFLTYGGNDVVTVAAGANLVIADGGTGSNTVLFGSLRSDAVISQQTTSGVVIPDAFTVVANGSAYSTAQVAATATDTLQFIDGAVYADASSPGGQVATLFNALLGRPADAASLGAYTEAAGRYGLNQVALGLLASPEGQAKLGGLGNAAYVTQLYQGALGHPPDAGGLAFWQGALDTGTADRGTVAAGIVSSPEAVGHSAATLGVTPLFGAAPEAVAADRIYQTLTANLPNAAMLVSATQTLLAGSTAAQLADSLVASSGTLSGLSSTAFVTTIELNVYGGTSATATSFWANGIDGGIVTRGQVVDAFQSSPTELSRANGLATQSGVAHA